MDHTQLFYIKFWVNTEMFGLSEETGFDPKLTQQCLELLDRVQ